MLAEDEVAEPEAECLRAQVMCSAPRSKLVNKRLRGRPPELGIQGNTTRRGGKGMAQVPGGAVPPTVPETIRWTPAALATISGAQQEGKTGCRQRRWPAAIVREKGAVTTHQTRPKPLKKAKETVQVQVMLRDESGGQRTKYNLVARQHRTAADTAGPPQPTRKGYGVEAAGSDVPRYTDAKKRFNTKYDPQ